jgi:hypothetical protein
MPAVAHAQAAGADERQMTAHGSVDVGYRWRNVEGNGDTFRQLFDLSEGARLFGADLLATGGDPSRRLFDTLSVNAGSLGDPFPSLLVRARRTARYDLRASWRRLHFFDVAPLTPASIGGFDTQAVTDRHSWSTFRGLGSVSLAFTPRPRLQILAGYDRVRNDGAIRSTRAVDFIGSPGTWGSFARANPYSVSAPADTVSNRVTGGISYARDRWTLHYKAGYQTSRETLVLDPLGAPERSINVGDEMTASELLSAVSWSEARTLDIPSSEVVVVARPASTLEWRTEHIYSRARGPVSLDGEFAGTARISGTATSPYRVAIAAEGTGAAPSQVFGQGVSYRPSIRWGIDVAYRFLKMDSESEALLTSVLSGYPPATPTVPVATSETERLAWGQTAHTFRATALIQPVSILTVRPGVRVLSRDVLMEDDGVRNPATSRSDKTVTPELSVSYRPLSWVDVRGVLRHAMNDAAYTRMSPSDRSVAHIGITLTPLEGLTITTAADRTRATLTTASFETRTTGGSVHASYAFDDRVTAFGSFDYRSLLALGDATFLRGPAPITDVVMRDKEADFVWQGGATLRVRALDVIASGIYDRTTGTDAITGEPPLYGPATFPSGTVTVAYNVPRLGRVAADVQRTRYLQDLLPQNDFRAWMLTIRLTRRF